MRKGGLRVRFLKRLWVTIASFVLVIWGLVGTDGKTITNSAKSTKGVAERSNREGRKSGRRKARERAVRRMPPTDIKLGAIGIIISNKIGKVVGYSTRAGGSGATHSVVKKLYDSVPAALRNKKFHGACAEADILSQIAYKYHIRRSVNELKNLLKGAKSAVVHNYEGKFLAPCSSCRWVLKQLGIIA